MNKIIIIFILLSINICADNKLKEYNFGYISSSMSNYSAKDLKVSMDIWIHEVTKDIGKTNMFYYDNPKDALADLKSSKLDFISAFPIVFVKDFDISELSGGFTGRYKNIEDNKFVLLVKNNNKIKNIKDLKSVKVGIQKNDEIMHIYTKLKINYLEILHYKNRSKIVLDLFFGKINVAIVPYRTFKMAKELNPQISRKIKILKKTEYVSYAVGFYHKSVSQKDKDFIFNTGKKLFETTKGRQMMDIYKIETLVHTKISDLENAKKLYNEYISKKGKK